MTDPLIARLDALAEKSTPGPWETCRTDTHRCLANTSFHSGITAAQVSDDALVPFADADFIAALVTAWPEIRKRLEAGEQLAKAAHGWLNSDDDSTTEMVNALDAYDAANAKGTG